jgi:hypothetical protein
MGCFMQPIFAFYSNTEAKGRRPFGSGHLNDVRCTASFSSVKVVEMVETVTDLR